MARAVACAAQIVDDDLRAAPRQFERIGAAEPAAGSGHDCNTTVEIDRHDILPHDATQRVADRNWHVLSRSGCAGKGPRKMSNVTKMSCYGRATVIYWS